MDKSDFDYPVVIVPLTDKEGGGFMGYAPDLTGCVSDGETQEEALANAKLAILEWLDEARARNMDIPAPFSAAERARQRNNKMLSDLKELADTASHVDDRLSAVERAIAELTEIAEHNQQNLRFANLVEGLSPVDYVPVMRS